MLGPTRAGPMIVDPDALECMTNAYLETNPKLEQGQHIFYVLANTFT
jgi:hypothetical protein